MPTPELAAIGFKAIRLRFVRALCLLVFADAPEQRWRRGCRFVPSRSSEPDDPALDHRALDPAPTVPELAAATSAVSGKASDAGNAALNASLIPVYSYYSFCQRFPLARNLMILKVVILQQTHKNLLIFFSNHGVTKF